jgi:predicted enzyme related to lactoylglutathione lyase
MDFQYQASFVTLATLKFEELVQFYRQLLGQSPHPYQPERYAEFVLTALRLGIFRPSSDQAGEFESPLKSRQSSWSLCFEVEDLDRAIAQLAALGCAPLGPILTASHGREVYAYDPDGNRMIVHQSP